MCLCHLVSLDISHPPHTNPKCDENVVNVVSVIVIVVVSLNVLLSVMVSGGVTQVLKE